MKNKKINTKLTIGIILIILLCIIFVYFLSFNSKRFLTNLLEKNTDLKLITKNDNNNNSRDIIVNNDAMFNKIITKGALGLAESYMDGDWDCNNLESTLYELISKQKELSYSLYKNSPRVLILFLFVKIKTYLPNNTRESVIHNISQHYDIGNDLYSKMLGKTMQYTCAYFNTKNMTLDEAQYAKMELVAKKLNLQPGMKMIDIGCGFGSMAYYFANKYNVYVTGVTLSKEQKEYADKYYNHTNVDIQLKDYRDATGKYDRVFSIGMFEHVGRRNYKEYYDKCYELLNDDGIMLIHTVTSTFRSKGCADRFITQYIFPEGELPHISNFTEKYSDKWRLEDLQNFGLSYSKTLNSWRNNIGNWGGLDNYDNRFRRMWDFYLYGCSAGFRFKNINLNQLVYTKRKYLGPDLSYIRNCNNNYTLL